jgi:hypothetical protein
MTAAVLFVAVFTVEGWRRPGYSPLRMFVSELALGPDGWVQIVSFLVTGALVLVFGRGLARYSEHGPASRAGAVLLQVIGISLMASGPFTTDPSAVFSEVSVHGIIHGVFGALVFALAPLSCFLFGTPIAPPGHGLTGPRNAAAPAVSHGLRPQDQVLVPTDDWCHRCVTPLEAEPQSSGQAVPPAATPRTASTNAAAPDPFSR